jgi:hypothetical protein
LGLIPLTFSVLFWVIPIYRFFKEKKENNKIKIENFKRFSFSKILSSPNNIDIFSFKPNIKECEPYDKKAAIDNVIKDIGVVSSPQIEITEKGNTIYSFNELENEKKALEKYRMSITRKNLGETVFDSNS